MATASFMQGISTATVLSRAFNMDVNPSVVCSERAICLRRYRKIKIND
jgi:hypothetical protein